MKKFLFSLLILLVSNGLWAQAPQKMSYQSVIRDANNVVVANNPVGLRISVVQRASTGPAVYVESHRKTTNSNGLLSLEIGTGTALLGTFSNIDWSAGPYFIKTETDPAGGTNYSISGSTELMSVPYALFSANGTPGPQGERGATGATGPQGPQGLAGINGNNGSIGPQGPIGLTGSTGIAGPQGNTGPAGPRGATGPAGAQGSNGAAGALGPQGPIGLAGSTGIAGPQGNTGPTGPRGETGPAGAPGNDGATGVVGPQGPIGLTGSTGVAGSQGNTGPAGPQGERGPTGAPGNDGTAGAIGPQGPIGLTGSAGIAGLQGNTGPTGPQGERGPTGAPGNDGAAGVVGPRGPIGLTGSTGVAGSQGNTGPTGPRGETGPAGAPGNDGAAGAIGPQGPIGLTGSTGITGPQGERGPTGVPGNDGAAGAIGPQGPIGLTGSAGIAGPQGDTGPAGPRGETGPAGAAGAAASSANFVDLTTAQTIAGTKTFSSPIDVDGLRIGMGLGSQVFNTAVGNTALASNTSGIGNTAIGFQGQGNGTTGARNTSVGTAALIDNTTGSDNLAIGYQALQKNIGSNNIAIGSDAMYQSQGAASNVVIGSKSMDGVSNGNSDNNVIGKDAMRVANGALRNVAVGNGTGGKLTSGNRNVIIGYRAGFDLVSEAHNTLVGHDANLTLGAGITNSTALGSNAIVTASNTIQLGNTSVTNVKTNGSLTAGTVTYPRSHNNAAGEVLTIDASGNASWAAVTGSSGVSSVGTLSTTSTANGASIASGVLSLAPADGTHGGVVTTDAQTFAGVKTFSSTLVGSISGNAATVTNGVYTTSKLSDLAVTTSTQLATKIPDKTGNGQLVFSIGPALVAPNLGAATGNSLHVTGQLRSSVATGTAPLVVSSTTPVANLNIGGNAATVTNGVYTTSKLNTMAATSSAELAGIISNETGSGELVFASSPTLVTPVLGAATGTSLAVSGQLSSSVATGTAPLVVTSTTPVANLNIGGNAATVTNGVYTTSKLDALAATSSAELAGIISDETGSGELVFASSPTLVTPVLGAATGTSLAVSGQLSSSVATGTAPLVVTSTTPVANLNIGGNAASATNLSGGAAGSIPYQSGAATTALLPKGNNGQVLGLSNGLPAWMTVGITRLSSISSSPNAFGASISGATLELQPANASFGGVVTTIAQTFAGVKTFSSTIVGSISGNATSATNLAGGAAGSIPYQSGTATTAQLAKGTDGQVLSLSNGLPVWVSNSASGITSVAQIGNNPNNSGLFISGTSLRLQPANHEFGGAVSVVEQDFAGRKNFIQDIYVDELRIGRGGGGHSQNVAFGLDALGNNESVSGFNTAIGYQSQMNGTTGQSNTSIGSSVLENNVTGSRNTALGYRALRDNLKNDNIAIGFETMFQNTDGQGNVAIGNESLDGISTSTTINNVVVGNKAGKSIYTEQSNTLLGNATNILPSQNISNATALGNGAVVAAPNTIQLGNASITNVITSGTLTAGTVTYPKAHGSPGQVLTTPGPADPDPTVPNNLSWGWAAIREAADQISATAGQTIFPLTQTPTATTPTGANSKVKMYINGLRVSITAYSISSGTTLTYTASNNGGYVLLANDRVQFDYYY